MRLILLVLLQSFFLFGAGSAKAVNIVLMGRLSDYFKDIPYEVWDKAIDEIVPEKYRELNHKALKLGRG